MALMTAIRCPEFEIERDLLERRGRLVDRYGHEHSEPIFTNWTPAAIRALGVRRVDDGDELAISPTPKPDKET